MADKAWKRLEREAARYFNVKRRSRGNDFSQSDVEVLVNVKDWLDTPPYQSLYIVVECKYRKEIGVVPLFLKETRSFKDRIPILSIGDFILCRLDDFEDVFRDFAMSDQDLVNIVSKYVIINNAKKEPKYLREYMEQAQEYTHILPEHSHNFPLVCMARAGTAGRIVAFSSTHLKELKDKYGQEQRLEEKTTETS